LTDRLSCERQGVGGAICGRRVSERTEPYHGEKPPEENGYYDFLKGRMKLSWRNISKITNLIFRKRHFNLLNQFHTEGLALS